LGGGEILQRSDAGVHNLVLLQVDGGVFEALLQALPPLTVERLSCSSILLSISSNNAPMMRISSFDTSYISVPWSRSLNREELGEEYVRQPTRVGQVLAVIVICLQIVWYHVSPSSALLIYSLLASSHRLHAQSGPWILVFFLQALLISILVFFLRALLLVLARWATLGWPRWGVTNYSWWRLAI
jgi:hypothetical protein